MSATSITLAARSPLDTARVSTRFFARPTPQVARALLGCALVHRGRAGLIVETEAYLDADDRASHARFGSSTRNPIMFGDPGRAYVYLCYGVHEMFNLVTEPRGCAGAVLIRAVAPLVGLGDDDAIGRGPGKVTAALGIDRRLNGRRVEDPEDDTVFVARALRLGADQIAVGPRLGVDYAGAWARAPLRFWWRGHPAVSRRSSPRGAGARRTR